MLFKKSLFFGYLPVQIHRELCRDSYQVARYLAIVVLIAVFGCVWLLKEAQLIQVAFVYSGCLTSAYITSCMFLTSLPSPRSTLT